MSLKRFLAIVCLKNGKPHSSDRRLLSSKFFSALCATDIQQRYEGFGFSHCQVLRAVTVVPMSLSHSAVPDVLQHAIIKHTHKGSERILDIAVCVRCGASSFHQDIVALPSPWMSIWLMDHPHHPILPLFHSPLQLR